ncbi:MAG: leucine-rich repeat domain-containing protein, partial [Treponema sp.]|nr:leucine-rich repeat domain-containing protein [Treponema sp.]
GDLRDKYLAEGGGPGTYIRISSSTTIWRKQDSGRDAPIPQVSGVALASHVAGLSDNSPGTPHTVKLDRVNIMADDIMILINDAVTNRYVIVDLSDCYATDNMISGYSGYGTPGSNDMNVIKNNQYIVGVILPNSLTSIGYSAFSGCSSLASVTIPGSVTSISNSAFSGCSNLRFTVTGTGSYRTLENGKILISNSNELAAYPSANGAVTIPGSVTSIGYSAFYGCTSLASVTIPGSVTSIGDSAFSWCTSLTSVTIPSSVTSIGNAAFYECSSLTSVTFAAGSNISEANFDSNSFPGDLWDKYFAPGGGPGTYMYMWTIESYSYTWTKQ